MDINQKIISFYAEVEPYVVTFYASQRNAFKAVSWDYKDLKQEILIALWQYLKDMIAKKKDDVEQIKCWKKSIKNLLIDFLRKAQMKRSIAFDSHAMNENTFSVEIADDGFIFDGIKKILSTEEYKVIYALYHENKPMSVETAKELGFKTKSHLTFYKDKAIEKLAKIGLDYRQNTTYGKRKR